MSRFWLLVLSILVLVSCGQCRDWQKYPAIEYLDTADRYVVTGDIHGALPQLLASLKAAGLVKQAKWCGGKSVWISVGDYCDRGKFSLEVYELIARLSREAEKAGGKVVSLLGNHELMLINGTVLRHSKSKSKRARLYRLTVESLSATGKSYEYMISPKGPVGKAIRRMPLMAIVKGRIGFIHGGFSDEFSRSEIESSVRKAVEAQAWQSDIFYPNGKKNSPLWVRNWWNDDDLVTRVLHSLQLTELVFGHTPTALVRRKLLKRYDRVEHFYRSQRKRLSPARLKKVTSILTSLDKRIAKAAGRILTDGRLFNVDIGMCPYYGLSQGGCLEITFRGDSARFSAMYPDGSRELLKSDPFQGAYEEFQLERIRK